MIFQSSMGLRNQGVIVLSGTTQGNFYPSTITSVILYSPYTNDDDNNDDDNKPPTLNRTFEFSNGIHVEKHGN
jgi:hypothetical protein